MLKKKLIYYILCVCVCVCICVVFVCLFMLEQAIEIIKYHSIKNNSEDRLTKEEFYIAYYRTMLIPVALNDMLSWYDISQDGMIDERDLRFGLRGHMTDQIPQMIKQADFDQDGMLSKQEFFDCLLENFDP